MKQIRPRTKELSETGTTAQQEASGSIEIGTELGERSDFTVLGEVQLEGTSELLHDLAIIRDPFVSKQFAFHSKIQRTSGQPNRHETRRDRR